MGGNILNFAVTMTTTTTASVSFTGKFVKKDPFNYNRKTKNNCTYLPLGCGMASQLKPDALSLYNCGVAGDDANGTIDNTLIDGCRTHR